MLLSTNLHSATLATKSQQDELAPVLEKYLEVKDALVKTDGKSASAKATELVTAIKKVKMDKLTPEQHSVWMKVQTQLAEDAEHISDTKDVSHQRDHFTTLSTSIYALQKTVKSSVPIYHQFCPMANNGKGAYWISKEKSVKNPYYGSKMLGCGKTVETIQ